MHWCRFLPAYCWCSGVCGRPHAEVLALKLGEPFGSILLAVAVTVIELD